MDELMTEIEKIWEQNGVEHLCRLDGKYSKKKKKKEKEITEKSVHVKKTHKHG